MNWSVYEQNTFDFAKVNSLVWFKSIQDRKGLVNKYYVRFSWEGFSKDFLKNCIGMNAQEFRHLLVIPFRFEESEKGFAEITGIYLLDNFDECIEISIGGRGKIVQAIHHGFRKTKERKKIKCQS